MPGKKVPPNLKDKLPKHAQHIYSEAYNNAWEEYKIPERRRGNESHEAAANKVAWAAVNKEHKEGHDYKQIK